MTHLATRGVTGSIVTFIYQVAALGVYAANPEELSMVGEIGAGMHVSLRLCGLVLATVAAFKMG